MNLEDIIAANEVEAPVAAAFQRVRSTAHYDLLPQEVRKPIEDWASAPPAHRKMALEVVKPFIRKSAPC